MVEGDVQQLTVVLDGAADTDALSNQEQFGFIQVFPSQRAHVASGTSDGGFVADPDCGGLTD